MAIEMVLLSIIALFTTAILVLLLYDRLKNKGKEDRDKGGKIRITHIGVLILVVLIGLFIGYYIWGPTWETPAELRYDVLKDTLIIVLAVIAVAVSLLSYLFYRMALDQVERETSAVLEKARRELATDTHRIAARLYNTVGFVYWVDAEKCRKREEMETMEGRSKFAELAKKETEQYLNRAISLTRRAYERHISQLDEQYRENQRLKCMVMNNLAFYLAERKEATDLDVARRYAEYIREKAQDFPDQAEAWIDTYSFVLRRQAE